MGATGAPRGAAGAAAMGAAALGGAPASRAVGAASAISLLSPPNMLSMSEQAARLRPAVNAKTRNRPLLSLCLAGIPLLMLSPARRPSPHRPMKEIWRPTPSAPVGLADTGPRLTPRG